MKTCLAMLLGLISAFYAHAVQITGLSYYPPSNPMVEVPTVNTNYYVLFRGNEVTGITNPVILRFGNGSSLFLDDLAYTPTNCMFYRVLEVPQSSPADVDGDGLNDLFELNYFGCLDALNPNDGTNDCDGDGLTNLQEANAGSNPTVSNAPPSLIINEVDYDNIGTDSNEFVEIYNAGSTTVNLTNVALAFVNGANNIEYLRYSLAAAGSLPSHQYLVVSSTNVVASGLHLYFTAAQDSVQNGAPDGIALIEGQRILDKLSYEGSMTAANVVGIGIVSLVEGTVLAGSVLDSNTTQGSLARIPDGTDTNDANTDWKFTTTPTPGQANLP